MVRATVLAGHEACSRLRDAWRGLAEAAGNAFLTPEWFDSWEQHYGTSSGAGSEVGRVIAVQDESTEDLVGLVPLAVDGREVRFAGANVGDRFAPLSLPGREDDAVRAVTGALADLMPRRPRLVLDNVDRRSGWVETVAETWPGGLAAVPVLSSVLPRLDLRDRTWESFLASRSRNFRSQLGRRQRALHREHEARFRLVDDPSGLDADLATFFALHDARWDSRGGSSSSGGRVRAFHADWARAALGRGWLRLWFLEVDGAPVAAWYGWHIGGRYCYYLAGFEPAWAARSVGLVLLAHTVEAAFDSGAEVYDLLLGDEEYKARFSDTADPVDTMVLASSLDPALWRARGAVALRGAADRLPGDVRESLRSVVRSLNLRVPGSRAR